MFVLWSSSIHTPIKYTCMIKEGDQITPATSWNRTVLLWICLDGWRCWMMFAISLISVSVVDGWTSGPVYPTNNLFIQGMLESSGTFLGKNVKRNVHAGQCYCRGLYSESIHKWGCNHPPYGWIIWGSDYAWSSNSMPGMGFRVLNPQGGLLVFSLFHLPLCIPMNSELSYYPSCWG